MRENGTGLECRTGGEEKEGAERVRAGGGHGDDAGGCNKQDRRSKTRLLSMSICD